MAGQRRRESARSCGYRPGERRAVGLVIVMAVAAADIGGALYAAWRAFLKAAGDDADGWDLAAAAEVRR